MPAATGAYLCLGILLIARGGLAVDSSEWAAIADARAAVYASMSPFPHTACDGFFDDTLTRAAALEIEAYVDRERRGEAQWRPDRVASPSTEWQLPRDGGVDSPWSTTPAYDRRASPM